MCVDAVDSLAAVSTSHSHSTNGLALCHLIGLLHQWYPSLRSCALPRRPGSPVASSPPVFVSEGSLLASSPATLFNASISLCALNSRFSNVSISGEHSLLLNLSGFLGIVRTKLCCLLYEIDHMRLGMAYHILDIKSSPRLHNGVRYSLYATHD